MVHEGQWDGRRWVHGEEAWKISLVKTEMGKARKGQSPGFVGTHGPPRETQTGKTTGKLRLVTDSLRQHAKGQGFYSGNDEKPF